MPAARDVLNSFVENLILKDIDDNYDQLISTKEDKDSNFLVEKYWIELERILKDSDDIGYRDNEAVKEKAIDISIKMIDAFVCAVHENRIPEPNIQEYCEYQIDLVMDIVKKRWGISEEYLQMVAEVVSRYSKRYVDVLDNLPFEEFYKYCQKLKIEEYKEFAEYSMRELGFILYIGLIEDFIKRFNEDKDPELRPYVEELAYLLEKMHYFDFLSSPELTQKLLYATVIFIDGSMERKYRDKEVIKECVKRIRALLVQYEIITEEWWDALTEIMTRYMKMMAENDERDNFRFYWLFSEELEILDRTGYMPDVKEAITIGGNSSPAPRRSAATAKKPARKKSSGGGGLREL